jgi:GntR family transcriptional regulator
MKKSHGNTEANERLTLSLDAPLIYLCRLRSVDDVPLVYLETFLPFDQYYKLMDVDLTVNSLYDSLEKLYRIRVNRVHREIEAINAPRKEAKLLQIATNRALNLVKTIAYADEVSAPVEFSIARYRGDLNKFSVEVYR